MSATSSLFTPLAISSASTQDKVLLHTHILINFNLVSSCPRFAKIASGVSSVALRTTEHVYVYALVQ